MPEIKPTPGANKLPRLILKSPDSETHVYQHGAHVTHFQPRQSKPILFMSNSSHFENGKPIRGGIPICFPWFGPKAGDDSAPAHGLVRTRPWTIVSSDSEKGSATFSIVDSVEMKGHWPDPFKLEFTVTSGKTLDLEMKITNRSGIPTPFEIALHTYLAVSDVRNVSISGLEKTDYIDKVDEAKRKTQGTDPIQIVGETDRVYLNTGSTVVVDDPGYARKIFVEKTGSQATVVWNPWIDKAKRLPDFGDNEWPAMLCIESCCCNENKLNLAPGETHVLKVKIGLVE